jgi:hypothetical protein
VKKPDPAVARLGNRLKTEIDPLRRMILHDLLAEEEAKQARQQPARALQVEPKS